MGIEGYGGHCPKCNKAMLNKWEKSGGGLMFDACPWCGFAYGTQDGQEIQNPTEIWSAIFEHFSANSHHQLIIESNLEPEVSEEDSDFYPSVFDHSPATAESPKPVLPVQLNFIWEE